LINSALEADRKRDFSSAVLLYREGLDLMIKGIREDKSQDSERRRAVTAKVAEYMARAEELSEILQLEELEKLPTVPRAPLGGRG